MGHIPGGGRPWPPIVQQAGTEAPSPKFLNFEKAEGSGATVKKSSERRDARRFPARLRISS